MTDAAAPDVTAFVLSADAAAQLWLTIKEDAEQLTPENACKAWQQWKAGPALAAGFYSTGQDILTLKKIVADFGTIFGRVYIKEYGGKPHVILKGWPTLRKVLTGTRYGVNNPKVISMGLGTRGAMNSIKEGGILTVVLVSAYDVLDYFIADHETLTDLVGQLASDISKVAITAGISAASVALLSGTIVTSFALGPWLVAVVVGVGVGFALNALDEHFKLTDKLKSVLAVAAKNVGDAAEAAEIKVQQAGQSLVDRAYDGLCAFLDRIVRSAEEAAADLVWRKINNLRWYLLPQ